MGNWRKQIIGAFIFIVMAFESTATERLAERDLVFGIVPQQSAFKLARDWVPLLEHVSELSGMRIRFATAPDIPTFEQRVARGDYDLAYMNPYHFTFFSRDPGFVPLVKARDKQIRGIVVARKEVGNDSLQALSDKHIAFPAPAAFAATLLVQAELHRQAIPFRTHYVLSHDAVYRGVASGRFAAGGGVQRTLNALPEDVRAQLKIVWRSKGFTPHAIAAHPRVGPGVRKAVSEALVSLAESAQGQAVLKPLRLKGFSAALDSDWDDVRDLHIEQVMGRL